MNLPLYVVSADDDWAEAYGIEAARLAARTLVDDGHQRANIFHPDREHPVEWADRDDRGAIVLHTHTANGWLR